MDAVSALLNVPCAEHRPTGTPGDCAVCGTPVAVHAELERLREENERMAAAGDALMRAASAFAYTWETDTTNNAMWSRWGDVGPAVKGWVAAHPTGE